MVCIYNCLYLPKLILKIFNNIKIIRETLLHTVVRHIIFSHTQYVVCTAQHAEHRQPLYQAQGSDGRHNPD